MDIRLEVLKLNGVWNVTDSGPKVTSFSTEQAALAAASKRALQHHHETGGTATVHLWKGTHETIVFNTETGGSEARDLPPP